MGNENYVQFTIFFGDGPNKLSISGLSNNRIKLSKNGLNMYTTQKELWEYVNANCTNSG